MRPWCILMVATVALAVTPRVTASQARLDSAQTARLLTALERSDSTVCQLAGQTLANNLGWGWEPRLFPMPMPMPTPMPMPMIERLDLHGNHLVPRIHVHGSGAWHGHELDAATLGAFRAVLRDDNECVRDIAARVLGRANPPGTY